MKVAFRGSSLQPAVGRKGENRCGQLWVASPPPTFRTVMTGIWCTGQARAAALRGSWSSTFLERTASRLCWSAEPVGLQGVRPPIRRRERSCAGARAVDDLIRSWPRGFFAPRNTPRVKDIARWSKVFDAFWPVDDGDKFAIGFGAHISSSDRLRIPNPARTMQRPATESVCGVLLESLVRHILGLIK